MRFQKKPDVNLLPPSLPALTTLYVGRSYIGPNTTNVLPFRKIAPALTTLGVYRFPPWLLDVNWRNLRALIMPVSVADFDETVPVLRNCGRLEYLEIGLNSVGAQDQMYVLNDGSDVELPFLRKLETVGQGLRLLPFLNAPLLKVIYANLLLDPFSAPGTPKSKDGDTRGDPLSAAPSGMDRLSCAICKTSWTVAPTRGMTRDAANALTDRQAKMFIEKHKDLCPWRKNQCSCA